MLTVLMALSLAMVSANSHADSSEELKMIPIPQSGGWIGIEFSDIDYFGASQLAVGNAKTDENIDDWKTILCDSAADKKCQIPGFHYDVTSIFSPCKTADDTNCIEFFKAELPDGRVINGKVAKLWNPEGQYKGDSFLGIPDGGMASSWIFEGISGNSENYVVIAGVRGGMEVPQDRNKLADYQKFQGQLFAAVQPVREISGTYSSPLMTLVPRGKNGVGVGGGVAWNSGCFMNDSTRCGLRESFPLDVKYSLKMRLDRPFSPWLSARLVDPNISVIKVGGNNRTITIEAKAMRVPEAGGYLEWSKTPDWMRAKYPAGTGGVGSSINAFTTQDLDNRILRTGSGTSGTMALKEFSDWIQFLDDRPFAMKTYWSIRGIRDRVSTPIEICAKNEFSGIVSSNATVFSAGAPTWNKENQSLDYTVGAPHFDTDGKILTGQYVLSMKSDVARCIYGFSSAPISARVEIASEDGNPNVATTVINENKLTGMLTLNASGFHYSIPKLSVKLMQSSSKQNTKITSIVCIKGKLKKTVKGTSPKCPTGYKKD